MKAGTIRKREWRAKRRAAKIAEISGTRTSGTRTRTSGTRTSGTRTRTRTRTSETVVVPPSSDKPTVAKAQKPPVRKAQAPENIQSYVEEEALRALIKNPKTPAAAKVTAARTLAEIAGRLGRFQPPPEREARPVAALSRSELVAELDRLRTLFGMGLIR